MRRSYSICEDLLFDMSLEQITLLAQLMRRAESVRKELCLLMQQVAADLQEPRAGLPLDLSGDATILVADDHPVGRAIARGILESHGYRVILPGSKTERDADVVLVDLSDADSGLLMRARRWAPRAQVVVCAPLPEGPARDRLRGLGVRAFVSKPYHPHELAKCIGRVVGGKFD